MLIVLNVLYKLFFSGDQKHPKITASHFLQHTRGHILSSNKLLVSIHFNLVTRELKLAWDGV